MSKILDLELPGGGLPPDDVRALNDRFLRIAEALAAATSKVKSTTQIGPLTAADLSSGTLQGTHAQRAGDRAEKLTPGLLYWESDRNVLYVVFSIGNSKTWAFVSGTFSGNFSARPADLSQYDAGFQFFASDWEILWRWDGKSWAYVAGMMSGPSGDQPSLSSGDRGFLFYAYDWNILYRWSGTEWVELAGQSTSEESSPVQERRYDSEIEELRRAVSAVDASGGQSHIMAQLEDLRRQVSFLDVSSQQTVSLSASDIPDLSATYALAGFPGVYASVSLTGQTGNLAANIQHAGSVLPVGMYRVAVYVTCTTIGAGSITVTLSWDDGTGSRTDSLGTTALNSLGRRFTWNLPYRLNGVTDLSYTATGTGGTYSIYIAVERLS